MKKTLALLTAVSAVVLSVMSGCSLKNINGYNYDNSAKYKQGEAQLSEDINGIDLGWVSGEVIVKYHDSDTVSFSEECSRELKENEKMRYYVDDGVLFIRFAKSGTVVNDLQKTLTLLVPENRVLSTLRVDTVSADTVIDGVYASGVGIETVSAEVSFSTAGDIDNFDIDSVSGGLKIHADGEIQTFDVNTVSGDVEIRAKSVGEYSFDTTSGVIDARFENTPSNGNVDSVSGNVTLHMPEDADFTLEITSVSGEFSCDFETKIQEKHFISGDGTNKIDVETISGDISVMVNK